MKGIELVIAWSGATFPGIQIFCASEKWFDMGGLSYVAFPRALVTTSQMYKNWTKTTYDSYCPYLKLERCKVPVSLSILVYMTLRKECNLSNWVMLMEHGDDSYSVL
jgi:hypothetical protein